MSFLTPDSTSIPLEKFSHSFSIPTSLSHEWIHESKRDGLFLVFHKLRVSTGQERLFMSISSGGNILERQDVDDLVDMTRRFGSMSQTLALDTSKIDAPVQIVVKRPCIAMRYTKNPTQIRRIQLRFKHDDDYHKSLDVFRSMELPIKEAGQPAPTSSKVSEPNVQMQPEVLKQTAASRPSSVSNLYIAQMKDSALDRNNFKSPIMSMSHSGDRPSSTASSETVRPNSAASHAWLHSDHMPPRPFSSSSSLTSGPAEGSARNGNEPSLYMRQMLGRSLQEGPSPESHGDPSFGTKFSHDIFQSTPQGTINGRDSASLEEHDASLRPNSPAPMPYPQDSVRHFGVSSSNMNSEQRRSGSVPSMYFAQMRATSHLQSADGSAIPSPIHTAHDLNHHRTTISSPSRDTLKLGRSQTMHGSSQGFEPFNSSMVRNSSLPSQNLCQDQTLPRPQSVPIVNNALSDVFKIPPKRELPFLKERAISKLRSDAIRKAAEMDVAKETSAVNPATSSTPLVGKKPAKRVAQRNTKKKPIVKAETNPTPPSAPDRTTILSPVNEEPPPSTNSVNVSKPPAPASSLPLKAVPLKRPSSPTGKQAPEAKRPKMVNQSTQTSIVSIRTPSPNTVNVTRNIAPISTTPSILDQFDEFMRTNAPRPAPIDPWRTPRYDELPVDERRAMVNDWICETIESNDFGVLCEDVEHGWRRNGMGF